MGNETIAIRKIFNPSFGQTVIAEGYISIPNSSVMGNRAVSGKETVEMGNETVAVRMVSALNFGETASPRVVFLCRIEERESKP